MFLSSQTLSSLTCTSKSFWFLGIPLLFKHIVISRYSQIRAFSSHLRQIEDELHCSPLVRTLTIELDQKWPASFDIGRYMGDVLRRSTNIESLTLRGEAASVLSYASQSLLSFKKIPLYISLQTPARVDIDIIDGNDVRSLQHLRCIKTLSLRAKHGASSLPVATESIPVDLSRAILQSECTLQTLTLDMPWLPAHLRPDTPSRDVFQAQNVHTVVLHGDEMNYTSLYRLLYAFPNLERLSVKGSKLASTAFDNLYRVCQRPLRIVPYGLRAVSLDVRVLVGAGVLPGLRYVDLTVGTPISSTTAPHPIVYALRLTPVKGIALTLSQLDSFTWLSEFISGLDYLEFVDVRVILGGSLTWKRAMQSVSNSF